MEPPGFPSVVCLKVSSPGAAKADVDDASAAYFDGLVEEVLLEAKQRGQKSDEELLSTLFDAVVRRYFYQR